MSQPSEQMQQLLNPQQFVTDSKCRFSFFTNVVHSDAVFQGQWYSTSQDGSQIPGSFSNKQNAQKESCQRTSRKDEAYPNNLSTEGSPVSQPFGSRAVATNNSSSSIC